ncbi:DUF5134 domain-containing protein [Pseudonocardia acaciae]|uniref:DUF5134 domain-containing protein n=1 Tax=Pseudonocardia acaciae TaxID=551276 RepID=UPI00048B9002|nr:DUF5134 domain-containing protein [Pseudonocardia acaciae]
MISSVPLSALLTVLYAATGGYALLRWAALRAGLAHAHGFYGDQVAELSHLVMSLAMLAMVWAYGGPAAEVTQIVAFTVFAGYFLSRLVSRRQGVTARHACPAAEFHLLMSVTMIWMVAGMPVLMGGAAGPGGSGGGHAGHAGHGGQAEAAVGGAPVAPVPVPWWAVALTVACIGALVVAAAFWAVRAVRHRPVDAPAKRMLAALTPRSEAVCHLAMSLGMAAMFVTMI